MAPDDVAATTARSGKFLSHRVNTIPQIVLALAHMLLQYLLVPLIRCRPSRPTDRRADSANQRIVERHVIGLSAIPARNKKAGVINH
jgi:hypothetical protein